MANTAVKIGSLPTANSLVGSSKIPVVDGADGNTKYVTVTNLMGNLPANVVVRATRLITGYTPANSSANGSSGDVAYDSSYFYVCVAANTWMRAALSTW